jgi:hypothetical protein
MIASDDYLNQQKLEYLKANDLFDDGKKQVFSAKTGKYIATIRSGDDIPITEEEQIAAIIENKDPNQLSLF